jgi:hypothetical protein
MSSVSRRVALVCIGSMLVGGGALSAVALGAGGKQKHHARHSTLKAGTTTTSTSTSTTATTPRASNEDPTHEAGESAAREAQEANGVPGGAFTPNEDATHEAGESAAREAQEDSGQRPTVP